jgi:Lar family restriction alleviation protein
MSEPKLKPCPFCGDKARIFMCGTGRMAVQCHGCPAEITLFMPSKASMEKIREYVIKAWNRRAR